MPWTAGAIVVGSMLSSNAANSAADTQAGMNAANLAEQQRVREQLRQDTIAQRAVADQAFQQYQAGLIDYATAQQRAAQAMQGVQNTIAQSQLSDVQKTQAMAQFTPYGIRTGAGQTFFNPQTGQAGVSLTPEMQQYQQGLFAKAGQAAGNIAISPQEAAQQYYQQQMDVLAPQRQAEDIALRQQQLQRGRIGLGVASEAAGAGAGGMLNPEQFSLQRAREQANAQIAAQATQAGQAQQANQLQLAQNLFSAGYAPESTQLQNLQMGSQLGAQQATAGYNQAALYNQGMTPYYANLLAAQQSAGQGMLAIPLAQQTGAQEAYNRQQTYLSGLQGSNLPYQAMNLGQPVIPGSAYTMAGVGNSLTNYGMGQLKNVNWNSMFGNSQPVNALDTSAYGAGFAGFNAAQADIYG